jgi:mannose-6-phosphate isomerase-like protein (cupin superfamily)
MTEVRSTQRIASGLSIAILFVQSSLFMRAPTQPKTPVNTASIDQGANRQPAGNVDRSDAVVERTMKRYPMASGLVSASQATSAGPAAGPAVPDTVKYFSSADVRASFEKSAPLMNKDGRSYWVITGRRDKPGPSELHEKDTDVFYVLEGSATFVTGGKMVAPQTTAPGEVRGSGIEGGEIRKLSKDDVIVIPAGVPHWFKDVPGTFLYFVVKVQ